MLDDMNVEFEYQVKRSLKEWLLGAAGTAPPPPPVQTESLPPPARLDALPPRQR